MSEAPAHVIDAVGRRCPLPVIDLAKQISEVPVGSVIELLADDPAAAADVPAWCRMRDHEFVGEQARGDATAYLVRRTH
jgi:TusA-related sulfurtransferase